MTFYEKYLLLCQKKGKSPSGAALEIPLSKTTVNRWKNGGGITDANAMRVAAYFEITVEELMSGVEGAKKAPTEISERELDMSAKDLTALQKDAVNYVLSLSPEKLSIFLKLGRAAFDEDVKDD